MSSYPATLFADSDSYEGPCTAKSTNYCAAFIAGLATSRFVKHLRGATVQPQILFNLNLGDMYVDESWGN